jgi:hypothetical protein
MGATQVDLVGMAALAKDGRRLTTKAGALDKALSAAGRQALAPVAEITRSRLPQDTGRLAGDVRVAATRSGAAVRFGRSSIRYAGWVEFGGHRRVPWGSTRDYQPRGRYLFPAALTLGAHAQPLYSTATQKGLDSFNWTNTTDDAAGVHD